MGLWVSDLLNSYQSTQVFRTGHYSLPLEGVAGIWIWLCHNKIYLIPLRALQYSDVPPPAPLPPTAHANNHFIGSQFSIFLTLYSVSNDWSPSTPTANYVIFHPHPTPRRMTGPLIKRLEWEFASWCLKWIELCINVEVKNWQVKLTWKVMRKWQTLISPLSLSFIWSWREMCSFALAVSLPNLI